MKKILSILIFVFLLTFLSATVEDLNKIDDLSKDEILEVINEAKKDSITSQQDFSQLIEDMEETAGLFNLYRKKEDGNVYISILPDQLEKIYLLTVTRQSGDAYFYDASAMLWSDPFFFQKVNDKVQMVQKNLKFRASEPAMRNAIENNISNSIITSAKIIGKPDKETGAILVEAEDLFLRDLTNIGSSENGGTSFQYDQENSYFYELKSFPLNTEIEVLLHYKSNNWNDIFTLADPRSMIHRYHYSISTLPEGDFKPRPADDRIGFFTTIFQDYSDLLTETPYVRYINRWHLEKEKPGKKVSKAKEPIVFWLENTIPEEFKPAVREGVLLWNDAYEAIGIKSAIVVKEMPEDADWDPADARYNTIRWFVQPGGGYAVGPSHANPFTGEIYDADIRISADFIRYYYQEYEEMIQPRSYGTGLEAVNWKEEYKNVDLFAEGLSRQISFGLNVLRSQNLIKNKKDLKEYVDNGIIALVVHEVGHTLGLRHNFKASTIFTSQQLQDKKFTSKNGLTGSVMDYTPVNLAPVDGKQGDYFQTVLGPWDYWMIEYGYTIIDKNEEEELDKIASKCTIPELDYGTDEDAFGYSVKGVDPLTCMFDIGADPLLFYEERLDLARDVWANLFRNFEYPGGSYKKLMNVFNQGWTEYRVAAHNATRYIGGLYTHRDHIGDPKGRLPFEVVPAAEQQRALDLLISRMLSEDSFDFSPELLQKLVYEKMEDFTDSYWNRERVDYSIHERVLNVQNIIFEHLYNELVLQRLIDNEGRTSVENDKFTMANMFMNINEAVWSELNYSRNISSLRRQLQQLHLEKLIELSLNKNQNFPYDAIALARMSLRDIKENIGLVNKADLDLITRAHLEEVYAKIDTVLQAGYLKDF